MVQIEFFTPEQRSSIPSYREKWREIALSTEPIDQQRAAAAIKSAYAVIGKRQPILEFCSSPQDALSKIVSSIPNAERSQEISLREMSWQKWLLWVAKWTFISRRMRSRQQNQPLNQLNKHLFRSPDEFLKQRITNLIPSESSLEEIIETIYQAVRDARGLAAEDQLSGFPDRSTWSPKAVLDMLINVYLPNEAKSQFYDNSWIQSDRQIESTLAKQGMNWLLIAVPRFHCQSCACTASWLDFCFSTLNLSHNQKKWQAFQAVLRECGWVITHEKTCFVCDRPIKISFDEERRLHGDTEAAVQFADGFSIWVDHGLASEA
ncbi:MAG: hypothetical protein HC936_01235 [Leptolyngbyaceae cyanobacterium SU_3_3]|nr:hypothetical protein [Leptolyngbyaceae cyanobacterium SU_3_3]